MSTVWRSHPERGSLFALHTIVWLAVHFGRPFCRVLLYPICLYFLLFAPRARKASMAYLSLVLEKPANYWLHVFKHLYWFASCLLDRVYFGQDKLHYFNIQVNGEAQLSRHTDIGKGCVLLSAHFGSFELLRVMGAKEKKLDVRLLMHEQNALKVRKIFNALNPAMADKIIPVGTAQSMILAHHCLQDGALIGMLGDRLVEANRFMTCHFFDRPAKFPTGPHLFANLMQAPVILCFAVYQGGNRYTLYLEELFGTEAGQQPDMESRVNGYVQRLEYYCRQAPYNWFNFYDFWAQS